MERRKGAKIVEESFLQSQTSIAPGNLTSCDKTCDFCCQKSFEIAMSQAIDVKMSAETRRCGKSTPSSRRKRDESEKQGDVIERCDVTGACSCVDESHHFVKDLLHFPEGQNHSVQDLRHSLEDQQRHGVEGQRRHCAQDPRHSLEEQQRHGEEGQRRHCAQDLRHSLGEQQRHGVEGQRRRVPRRRRSSLVKSAHFPGAKIHQNLFFV